MPEPNPTARASLDLPSRMFFDRFELRPHERRLLVGGEPAALGARAFDLLLALVGRPGNLVTKNELLDLVWPGLVVEEANLTVQMSSLRKVLGGEVIGTIPGRGYRFTARVESGAPVPAAAAPAPPAPLSGSVLPAIAGRMIGRDDDLARLEPALREPGCVTLVGPGGVGKTRLALAAAQRWDGRRVWIDLAPLTVGVQVAGALARSLSLPLADGDAGPQLVRALGSEPVLLVLDNAEHLVDATSALAAALLAGVPHLHLLVTSQVALALPGERVQHVEPLAIEDEPGSGDGAMALLVERIVAADHRVRIEPASAPLLREICRQLDALPLALEMAAARVPLLGLRGVRDKLAERFKLLTTGHRQAPPRHRTLHAALDWSFDLLGAEEQRLFAALGVFAGGFTLELCVALCVTTSGDDAAARWELIDRLVILVDRSLVTVGSGDPPRYRLLETMRAYALQKLQASGAESTLRRRHAEVLLEFIVGHSGDERGRALCLPELDNVREAIAWAQPHAPGLALELAMRTAGVTTFTPWRGQAYAWMCALEPLMASPQAESFGLELRVQWWNEFARTSISGMYERANEVARKARALARTLAQPLPLYTATMAVVRSLREPGPELDEACAELVALGAAHPQWPARVRLSGLGSLAVAAKLRGDFDGLLAIRREELAMARQAGLHTAADAAETNIVAVLNVLGRHAEALQRSSELVQRLEGAPSLNLAWAWEGLVAALLELGRVEEARARLPQAIAVCRQFDMPICAPSLARLAVLRQRPEAAARLVGYAQQAFEQRGMATFGSVQQLLDRICAEVQPMLAAGQVETLTREGRVLGEGQALELACGD